MIITFWLGFKMHVSVSRFGAASGEKVYNSVSALVDSQVPAYLMSTVKEADA